MIKYISASNMLEFETKKIPQNNGAFTIEIEVENKQLGERYFLELKCPKDRRFISEELKFSANIGTVELGEQITSEIGNVYVQLVKRSLQGEILGKSLLLKEPLFKVTQSINAVEKQEPGRVSDCIESITKKANELGELYNEIQNKVNNGDFNGKDGTLIKVNGVVEKSVGFTKDPQQQLDKKMDLSGGKFDIDAQVKWEPINGMGMVMGYTATKDAFILASLDNGQNDNLTILPKSKKIYWRGKELVTSDYWRPTNKEINNIFGEKQTSAITNWTAPADGYIYVSISFGDNNKHYASIFAKDYIRAERCVAGQTSDFGWQVMTLKVYKNLVYSLDLPEYATVLNIISKFTYASGEVNN